MGTHGENTMGTHGENTMGTNVHQWWIFQQTMSNYQLAAAMLSVHFGTICAIV